MSESHLVPEQLNYSRKNYAGPKYKFSRIVPLSGSQQVDIPLSSTAEVLMEVPTNVFNNAESYLYADGAIPLQGVNEHIWMHCDGMPLISEVDLYTRSGVYLCQLPNFQNYMKIVRKLYTTKDEMKSSDPSSFLYPSNVLGNAAPGITPNNGPASNNYEESAYIISTATLGQAANTQLNFTLNMPLKAIKKTIFALNKDIVFPDIIVFRILFGPANKACYIATDGGNPAGSVPAAPVAAICVAPAPTNGTAVIRLYNLTLFLATEKNEDLAQSVRALVNSPAGLNLLVDFPYSYKQNLSGTSQSISLRFNRGHGKNLMAVISSPFNATETLNTAFDCFNVANASSAAQTAVGAKVLNYYSQLDNVRLQDITLVCGNATQDDYREHRRILKNTPYLNSMVYNNNWFHQDIFYEKNLTDDVPEENLDKGMSLIVERKYDLLATMAGATAFNWYTFALLQKDLHIGSQMIQYQ
jgi:hypothetical protein